MYATFLNIFARYWLLARALAYPIDIHPPKLTMISEKTLKAARSYIVANSLLAINR